MDDKVNILVVDDLPDKRLAFQVVLEELGQNLVMAASGADALRELLLREFAVILLDVNMPDIDGIETAELIRQHSKTKHTPIIFVTAYADEMQTARGYALGAVDYILSPVIPEILRSKVKVFVELYRAQKRAQAAARLAAARAAAAAARGRGGHAGVGVPPLREPRARRLAQPGRGHGAPAADAGAGPRGVRAALGAARGRGARDVMRRARAAAGDGGPRSPAGAAAARVARGPQERPRARAPGGAARRGALLPPRPAALGRAHRRDARARLCARAERLRARRPGHHRGAGEPRRDRVRERPPVLEPEARDGAHQGGRGEAEGGDAAHRAHRRRHRLGARRGGAPGDPPRAAGRRSARRLAHYPGQDRAEEGAGRARKSGPAQHRHRPLAA